MASFRLFVGLRYTLAKKSSRSVSFITGIAMLGIVLGVALLITVLSVMNGFDRELKQRILSIMPQVSVYQRGGIQDWQVFREQMLQHDKVIGVSPFVEMQVMLHEGQKTQPAFLYGVDGTLESTVSSITDYLSPQTLSRINNESSTIALGRGLADKLKLNQGDTLTLIAPRPQQGRQLPVIKRLKLIDVFETGTELDHSLALMGLLSAAQLNQVGLSSGISGLRLRVEDLFSAPQVAKDLMSQLPPTYYTDNWTRTHGNIYYAISMSKRLVSLLLFLIIAIAAFNVVSTLVMVVVDKQSDIAILKTLGLSKREVTQIFMVQGAVIGVIGTVLGVLLGVGLALSVEALVAGLESFLGLRFIDSSVYPISFLPSALLWSDVIFVAIVTLLMSVLATVYPARKAARIEPAKALRYD